MNKVMLIGRITKDLDLRYTNTQNQMAVVKFSIAVNRIGKSNEADFINCVVFGNQAENLEKYMGKGSRIGITGTIRTGSYTDKNNHKVYTTEVLCENIEYLENKKSEEDYELPSGFESLEEDDLPF